MNSHFMQKRVFPGPFITGIILRTLLLFNINTFLKIEPYNIKEYTKLIITVYNSNKYKKQCLLNIVFSHHDSLRLSLFGNI